MFIILSVVRKELLKSFFQIAGWTPERLDRSGVALVERGDTSLSVYGRTHLLLRPEEEEEFTNAAAAFGGADDDKNELGMLQSAAASGCEGIPVPLIILGVIGSITVARILVTETVNYIQARNQHNYPGGKTLHFFK